MSYGSWVMNMKVLEVFKVLCATEFSDTRGSGERSLRKLQVGHSRLFPEHQEKIFNDGVSCRYDRYIIGNLTRGMLLIGSRCLLPATGLHQVDSR